MDNFIQGQRWISDSEPELGLGILRAAEGRSITLEFPRSGEHRHYARGSAPLTRISFQPGDEVRDRGGRSFEVLDVDEDGGLLVYRVNGDGGKPLLLPESELDDAISLDRPLQRLLAGQVDAEAWYLLRHRALEALNFIERSPLLGLCSARTELIAHQLYIADEVARRHAPRVLLADEVGLGKTIEAGLILQQQLFSGLASRVLILVPEALLHQWLVEMLRRFNLRFSIFDAERCDAAEAEGAGNPFFTEQLVLCSADFFLADPARFEQALEAEWDLLVVDEAHHLQAPPEAFDNDGNAQSPAGQAPTLLSNEGVGACPAGDDRHQPARSEIPQTSPWIRAYLQVRDFSTRVKGLILLTATPDQAGPESHFALLQLLDPDRFYDFQTFRQEQSTFSKVANLVERLEALRPEEARDKLPRLGPTLLRLLGEDKEIGALLQRLADLQDEDGDWDACRDHLIQALLDRHGTGRVLFRNSRRTVHGFPPRVPHPHPLPCPEPYRERPGLLHPEHPFQYSRDWLTFDPRVEQVLALLAEHRSDKFLLICAEKDTALELEEHLRLQRGVRSAVFVESMSIVERDRAAAWFAAEDGARLLVCSEIGSEGRNFQFSHRLVLFDLPLNPDLLEQRIGRLDRIGQRHPVDIHVPYIEETAQELLFRWYHEGLHAFGRTNPVAFKVWRELREPLERLFECPDADAIEALLDETARRSRHYQEEFARGRDRLLEMNSFDPQAGADLILAINRLEEAASPEDFMEEVFDSFGIDAEENSDGTWTLRPGEGMLVEHFAGIPDEGATITFERRVALHREEVEFVSWQHSLVRESIDMILQGYYGKTAIGLIRDPRLPSGSLLLEALFRVEAGAPRELQLQRFLPSTALRVLVDAEGHDLSEAIGLEELAGRLEKVDRAQLLHLVPEHRDSIVSLSERARALAERQLPAIVRRGSATMLGVLTDEIKRLVALQQVNPNVREAEIDFLKHQTRGLHHALSNATLQLEALQVVFIA